MQPMKLTTMPMKTLVRGSLVVNMISVADTWVLDVIQGIQKEWREADALPPRNAFEWITNALYRGRSELSKGNSLYAIKAGVFTG